MTTAGRRACSARQFVASIRVGFEEKGKHGRKFYSEVRGEATRDVRPTGPINERVQLVLKMPASDRHAARRDATRIIAVADPERLLQNALDTWRQAPVSMIEDRRPTTA